MKFFDKLLGRKQAQAESRPRAALVGDVFYGLDDPALLEYIRTGLNGGESAMLRNTAALRCLTLIGNGLGMLPTNLYYAGDEKRIAKEHPGYKLLRIKPNPWQTPMEFKSQMQLLLETEGNAYA